MPPERGLDRSSRQVIALRDVYPDLHDACSLIEQTTFEYKQFRRFPVIVQFKYLNIIFDNKYVQLLEFRGMFKV